MKTNHMTRESGFTLLELLLVIGVASLLLIGGIATYRLVSDGNKATETTRLLLTLRQEAAVMAQQQNDYDGITYETTNGATNTPFVVGGILRAGQRNPFGGEITIAPDAGNLEQLLITMNNISKSACIKLVQAISNPAEVLGITINGQAEQTVIPVPAVDAADDCDQAAGAVTEIVWRLP